MDHAREVSARLLDLLRREQSAMAEFLVALADFDRRRLWRDLGYASLFHYLHRELGMSKGAAHYRKTAAELIQEVPEVADALRRGKLCITSIIELSKVLTPENRAEVLPGSSTAPGRRPRRSAPSFAPPRRCRAGRW